MKPLTLPAEVGRAFLKDMHAYFKEDNLIKRDEIAARQMHILRQYQGLREKKLRLSDVKAMFDEMRER